MNNPKNVQPSHFNNDFWCGNCYKPTTHAQLHFLPSNKGHSIKVQRNHSHRSLKNVGNTSIKKSLKKRANEPTTSPVTPVSINNHEAESQYYNIESPRQKTFCKQANQFSKKVYFQMKKQTQWNKRQDFLSEMPQVKLRNNKSCPKIKLFYPTNNIKKTQLQISPIKVQVPYSPVVSPKINFVTHSKTKQPNHSCSFLQQFKISIKQIQKLQQIKQPKITINEFKIQNQDQSAHQSKASKQNKILTNQEVQQHKNQFVKKELEINQQYKVLRSNIKDENKKVQQKIKHLKSSKSLNYDTNIQKSSGKTHLLESMKLQRKKLQKIDDADEILSIQDSSQERDDPKESVVLDRLLKKRNPAEQTIISETKTVEKAYSLHNKITRKNSPINSLLTINNVQNKTKSTLQALEKNRLTQLNMKFQII